MDNLEQYIKNQTLMRPRLLGNALRKDNQLFNYRKDYYDLIKYVEDFLNGNPTNRYLILPGIRDVGKTTIMFQIYRYLLQEKNINPNNILYLSADNLKFMCNSSIMEAIEVYLKDIHQTTFEMLKEPIFIFIDEAQYDENWSITGKLLFDMNKNIFMIFSGSSALELTYNADSARRLLKMPIYPLSYYEYLILKYDYFKNEISNNVLNLIFDGKTNGEINFNSEMIKYYSSLKNFDINEWEYYLQYGGFPSLFNQNRIDVIKKINDIINRVVTVDMKNFGDFNVSREDLAFQIIYFLALQNPGEVSKGSLANTFNTNIQAVTKILNLLEKTQLIFNVAPFTSSSKRTTKPVKYYFATASIKNALSTDLGNATLENRNAYIGKLFENFVASSFHNLNNKFGRIYKTYYDDSKNKKGKTPKNVDFVVQRGLEKPIPIEASWGKKDKGQIKKAISKFNSPHGIIISNTYSTVKKDNDVIYLPAEVFAFM